MSAQRAPKNQTQDWVESAEIFHDECSTQKVNLTEVKYADPFGYLNMNASSPSAALATEAQGGGGQELRQPLVGDAHRLVGETSGL